MVRPTEVFFLGGPLNDELRSLNMGERDPDYIYVTTLDTPIIYPEDGNSPVVKKHRYNIRKTMCDGLYGPRAIATCEGFDEQYLIDLAFDALLQKGQQ